MTEQNLYTVPSTVPEKRHALNICINLLKRLARLDGKSLNSLFETLEDWNTHLKGVKSEPQS